MRRRWRLFRVALLATTCTTLLVYIVTQHLNTVNYKNRRKASQPEPLAIVLMVNEAEYISPHLSNDASSDPLARHAFNLVSSDRLPSDRALPDTRHTRCLQREYELTEFATTSVVIAFHNEARSALLRTVVSVLNRTPLDLLEEIILIDDFSDNADDGALLSALHKVRVVRHASRLGLIAARNRGAQEAHGDHLMFLDSHTEVNVGWLEPLMAVVAQDGTAVASPVIDVIDLNTFQYRSSSTKLKGGFDWSLHFKWIPVNDEEASQVDPSEPFASPTIAGGLFLISRLWFDKLGGFDPDLRIWGAESLEISLKTWLCGGSLAIVPCSRVGHVFRKSHPYTFPEGNAATYLRNSKRVAEVWLGEHKRFFYDARPNARDMSVGGLDGRIALREWLQCKSFPWYLETVFPELRLPNEESTAFGELKQESLCLTATDSEINLTQCLDETTNKQSWSFSVQTSEIKHGSLCLTSSDGERKPRLVQCAQTADQKWSRQARSIVQIASNLCLESGLEGQVSLSVCRHASVSQQWDFTVELQTQDHAAINIT